MFDFFTGGRIKQETFKVCACLNRDYRVIALV